MYSCPKSEVFVHLFFNEVLETVLNHVINSGLGEDLSFGDNANVTKCSKWDYENSLFFAFTVVTTIGKSGDIISVFITKA